MNAALRKATQPGTEANVWLYRRTNGRVDGRGMGRRSALRARLVSPPGSCAFGRMGLAGAEGCGGM